MALVLAGKPNKNIASDLHLSQRHRREPPGIDHETDQALSRFLNWRGWRWQQRKGQEDG